MQMKIRRVSVDTVRERERERESYTLINKVILSVIYYTQKDGNIMLV